MIISSIDPSLLPFLLYYFHFFCLRLSKLNLTCFSKGWERIKAENWNSRKRSWYLQTEPDNSSRSTRRTRRVSRESQRNQLHLELKGKTAFDFWSTEVRKNYGSLDAWQGTHGSSEQGIKSWHFAKNRGVSDKKRRAHVTERIAAGEVDSLE